MATEVLQVPTASINPVIDQLCGCVWYRLVPADNRHNTLSTSSADRHLHLAYYLHLVLPHKARNG